MLDNTYKPKRTYEENLALVKARCKPKNQIEPSDVGASDVHVKVSTVEPSHSLPMWSEYVRGVPNSILRSALFGAIKRGRRSFQQGTPLASVEGIVVIFTGPRLDQADLDVWEQCLHLARTGGLGTRIKFSVGGFLKAIGRSSGGHDIEWLKNAFRRLSSSVVEIKDGKRAYFGPMIHGGARNDETNQYVIEMNPAIVKLYGIDGWTGIQFDERQALKKQPLSQWLHAFYSTHEKPFSFKVETLHMLCGSDAKQLFSFRQELREALGKLSEVTGWTCNVGDNDLVHIVKNMRKSKMQRLLKNLSTGTG